MLLRSMLSASRTTAAMVALSFLKNHDVTRQYRQQQKQNVHTHSNRVGGAASRVTPRS